MRAVAEPPPLTVRRRLVMLFPRRQRRLAGTRNQRLLGKPIKALVSLSKQPGDAPA